jgi:hypothetical protein
MTHSRPKAVCSRCHTHETRSATGICWQCRPAPAVRRDGDGVHIGGIGHLSTDAALRLAHDIADAVTP